jgi:hypothetical protein
VVNLLQLKLEYAFDIFSPKLNLKKQMYNFGAFHLDYLSDSSNTYDMIMSRNLHRESGIIMNFNDYTVTWDADTNPIKNRETALYNQKIPYLRFI